MLYWKKLKLKKLFTTMIMTKLKRTHEIGLYSGLHSQPLTNPIH